MTHSLRRGDSSEVEEEAVLAVVSMLLKRVNPKREVEEKEEEEME